MPIDGEAAPAALITDQTDEIAALLERIAAKLAEFPGCALTFAIEGDFGTGKSPLAQLVAEKIGGTVVLLDDVFPPAEGAVSPKRTCLRKSQIGQARTNLGDEALPLGQSGRASVLVLISADEVAVLGEVIMEGGVNGAEFLECLHPPKPQHRPLSSSKGQM
jgi:hypothetical protein